MKHLTEELLTKEIKLIIKNPRLFGKIRDVRIFDVTNTDYAKTDDITKKREIAFMMLMKNENRILFNWNRPTDIYKDFDKTVKEISDMNIYGDIDVLHDVLCILAHKETK
jgi:hypothetical protein